MIGRARTLRWSLVLVYAGGIFMMSSMPGGEPHSWSFPHADKVAHSVAYGGLGHLLRSAVDLHVVAGWAAGGLALAGSFAYGVTDEMHQGFVPGRHGNDPGDLVADALGGFVGAVLLPTLRRSRGVRSRSKTSSTPGPT